MLFLFESRWRFRFFQLFFNCFVFSFFFFLVLSSSYHFHFRTRRASVLASGTHTFLPASFLPALSPPSANQLSSKPSTPWRLRLAPSPLFSSELLTFPRTEEDNGIAKQLLGLKTNLQTFLKSRRGRGGVKAGQIDAKKLSDKSIFWVLERIAILEIATECGFVICVL